ncbi:MAG: glycine/sarcosine/betaine reductase complex component C subunit alpha [Paraclostridium sp.]|uniref:glycine/sarcosine/betaine reductase complex component C subunit alpha n=1 Tax=Paraclostridium sp. TaxID=2023273 RepID=UPI003F3FDF45
MPKKIIADTFLDIANAIESGEFGKKVRVGLTTLGSEHGTDNLVKGAHLAQSNLFDIVLIGPKVDTDLEVVEVNDESQMHAKMEELLDSGFIDACVTMHYNFPIGVSTVGRVVTPGRGKEMILATTTGTSATNRIEAMVRNAVYGISTAKSIGMKNPTVGILNVDGARQVEKALKDLQANGYDISFAESVRADGGCVMRGNDLLCGAPDVMVTDTLSGNIFMKVFSSFNTGGDYEAAGFGYGPGVGEDYDRKVLILSRASGSPVVANALKYAYDVVKGDVTQVSKDEFKNVKNAKYDDIIAALTKKEVKKDDDEDVKMPEKEVVTHQIAGVDIMDLEDAVKVLWKNGIYAESGMGCTGPIVLVADGKGEACVKLLLDAGYTAK